MTTTAWGAKSTFRWHKHLGWIMLGLSLAAPTFAQAQVQDPAACSSCRDANCRNIQGAGIDAVKGCLVAIDPAFGASASDPTFLQECIDVVGCAQKHDCAYSSRGLAGCYCGLTISIDACVANGPGPDAACVSEVQKATRATLPTEIAKLFSSLDRPIGWANSLTECDRDLCPACTPNNKCGNGKLDPGEGCDDGNTVDNDGCTSTCRPELCGDKVKQANEACDDGNADDFDGCTTKCTVGSVCGNGKVEANEQCDDGNRAPNDGCSSSCQREICGDRIRQANEECDDGNNVNNDACNNKCKRRGPNSDCDRCRDQNCRNLQGTGIDVYAGCFEAVNTELGPESASDPNFLQKCIDVVNCAQASRCAANNRGLPSCYCGDASFDQCISTGPGANAKCVAEIQTAAGSTTPSDISRLISSFEVPLGWANFLAECDRDSCAAQCLPPVAVCGNRKVEAGETCDDGNKRNNDGCSSSCKREVCGDGIRQRNEDCDDGNTRNNDGCSSRCTNERRRGRN